MDAPRDDVEVKRFARAPPLVNFRYRVVRKLGEGAMGSVLLVQDTLEDGDFVAMKLMRPDAFSPETRDASRNEFRAMTQLRHPNVVEVYDFGAMSAGADHYFTMEYVDGHNLLQVAPARATRSSMTSRCKSRARSNTSTRKDSSTST